MELRQIDLIYWDAHNRIERGRRFRAGEPGGMLVAIAGAARFAQRLAARIERWARHPASADFVPRIPVR